MSLQSRSSAAVFCVAFLLSGVLFGQASLDAPAEAPSGAYIEVRWEGPNGDNDLIYVVRAGSDSRLTYPVYAKSSKSPQMLAVGNLDPGHYEIRYVQGRTNEVLARKPLTVVAASATLKVPAEVAPGSTFEVNWEGWGGYQDYIGIVLPDTAPGLHPEDFALVSEGNPLVLKAPGQAGQYVVRYSMGSTHKTAAEVGLTVAVTENVPESQGELRVIFRTGQWTSVEFESFEELGQSLRQAVDIRYENEDPQPISVVFSAVLVDAEGEVLSRCASDPIAVQPGTTSSMPDLCADDRYGTIFDGSGIQRLDAAAVALGDIMVINHEEQYFTDMRPLSIVTEFAISMAQRLRQPVLLLGASPSDPEVARVVQSFYEGWP